MPSTKIEASDGRRQRVVRGKEASIDALLAIYTEGHPYPTFADIALRAGISERTLFRYFGSYDEFIAEAAQALFPRIKKFFTTDVPAGDLRHRLVALAELRYKFVRQYGAMVRSVDVLAAEWASARNISEQREALLARQLTTWLGEERSSISEDTFVMLQNILGWRSIDRVADSVGKRAPELVADAALAVINASR
jgi:AcrR family transcriptional regulator